MNPVHFANAVQTSFVFRFLGVPVAVSLWLILLGVIITLDASIYIKKMMPNPYSCGRFTYFCAGVIAAIGTIISIVFHELGHGVVSGWFGIPIVKAGLTGWGAYVQPAANILEINPWKEIAIAVAGPLANFLIAGIAAIYVAIRDESLSENTVQYLAYINIRLARLNLLPILVLDGGRVTNGFLRLVFSNNTSFRLTLAITFATIIYYLFLRKSRKPVLEDKLATL